MREASPPRHLARRRSSTSFRVPRFDSARDRARYLRGDLRPSFATSLAPPDRRFDCRPSPSIRPEQSQISAPSRTSWGIPEWTQPSAERMSATARRAKPTVRSIRHLCIFVPSKTKPDVCASVGAPHSLHGTANRYAARSGPTRASSFRSEQSQLSALRPARFLQVPQCSPAPDSRAARGALPFRAKPDICASFARATFATSKRDPLCVPAQPARISTSAPNKASCLRLDRCTSFTINKRGPRLSIPLRTEPDICAHARDRRCSSQTSVGCSSTCDATAHARASACNATAALIRSADGCVHSGIPQLMTTSA
jgi:hypothetical protein